MIEAPIKTSSGGTDVFYGKEGPTEKQTIFRDAHHKYKLFGGGVGGGKTYALCAEGLRLSMMFPGNRGFLGRHEAEAFRKTTLVTLLNLIADMELETGQRIIAHNGHNQTKKEILLVNGSAIIYGGIGGREDMDRIKSLEIGFFCVDEASETVHEVINMLKARLRWKLPGGQYPRFFGLFASNPEPGWLKNTFVVPQQQGVPLDDHLFVQSLLKDNPWLPPEYLANLRRDNPENWVRRYVDGSWDAVEGQVWPDFDFQTHVLPNDECPMDIPYPVKGTHTILGSLDHGQTNPTCFLGMYVDQDGNILVFDEYYRRGLVSDHTRSIDEQFELNAMDELVADPSIWDKNREKDGMEWSVADEYDERGIYLTKANNSREAGWNRVGEFFRSDKEHFHPFMEKKGAPRLFISKRCRNLLTELPEYIWKKTSDDSSNPKEEARKLNDHACDALRYGVMTRPSPYEHKRIDNAPVGSFNWILKQREGGAKRGRMVNR